MPDWRRLFALRAAADPAELERAHEQREITGSDAQRILEDPVFQSSLREAREQVFSIFERSKMEDAAVRDDCWYQLRALRQVERVLRIAADRGKISAKREEMRRTVTQIGSKDVGRSGRR